jgi:hypothetical protein
LKILEKLLRSESSIGEKKNDHRILKNINYWLVSDWLLNTGYEIVFDYYREILISSSHPLISALNSGQSLCYTKELADEILGLPQKFRILLRDKSRNINLTPYGVGTGISQILPVVVAAVTPLYNCKENMGNLVAIEQPELHIHPAMQVQLGDLFISCRNKKDFLIETHSEHLLLRILRRIRESSEGKILKLLVPDVFMENSYLRYKYKKGTRPISVRQLKHRLDIRNRENSDFEEKEVKISSEEVAIYYVESENGNTQVNRIRLDENGRFVDHWPHGFFEEREKEYFGEQEDLSDELGRLFGK